MEYDRSNLLLVNESSIKLVNELEKYEPGTCSYRPWVSVQGLTTYAASRNRRQPRSLHGVIPNPRMLDKPWKRNPWPPSGQLVACQLCRCTAEQHFIQERRWKLERGLDLGSLVLSMNHLPKNLGWR